MGTKERSLQGFIADLLGGRVRMERKRGRREGGRQEERKEDNKVRDDERYIRLSGGGRGGIFLFAAISGILRYTRTDGETLSD